VTKIFTNDTADNKVTNVTTVQVDYARTELSATTDLPDPIFNGPGAFIKIYTTWNTTEDSILSIGNCNVTILGTQYVMQYSSSLYRHEYDFSVAAGTAGFYPYTVICYNTSYGNATENGLFELKVASSGGGTPPSGGAAGSSYIIGDGICSISIGEPTNSIDCTSYFEVIPVSANLEMKATDVTKIRYIIENKGGNPTNITVSFDGDYARFNPKAVLVEDMNNVMSILPNFISLDTGKTKYVYIELTAPFDIKDGVYSFQVNFMDVTTMLVKKTTLAVTIDNSISAPEQFIDLLGDKFSKSLVLTTGDCTGLEDEMCMQSKRNMTIDWFGLIGAFLTVAVVSSVVFIPTYFRKDHRVVGVIIIVIALLIYLVLV
jgi:hypothetical protein